MLHIKLSTLFFFLFFILWSCQKNGVNIHKFYQEEKAVELKDSNLEIPKVRFIALTENYATDKDKVLNFKREKLSVENLRKMGKETSKYLKNPYYNKMGISRVSGNFIEVHFEFDEKWKKYPKMGVLLRNVNFCFPSSNINGQLVNCFCFYTSFIGNYKIDKDVFLIDEIAGVLDANKDAPLKKFAIKYDIYLYEIKGRTRFIKKIGEDIQYFE